MKNFIANGKVLEVTATAAITSGAAILVGDIVGVPIISAAIGEKASVSIEGVYELPKATGAIAQGKKVYWIVATSNFTGTAGSNVLAGIAYEAAASADTTVKVALSH
jgi:predicted RecA/RadA family phage recombinase